ncbi:MAG: hypothetical protein RLO08_13890 [Parvibaculaceae bacterium]
MATLSRRARRREEEGESVFVSMTDLSVSFLFILLILLAFFATQFRSEKTVPLEVHHAAINKRDKRIAELKDQLGKAEAKIQHLTDRVKQLENTVAERDETIRKLETEIRKLRKLISELEETIEQLRRLASDPLAKYLQAASEQRNHLLAQIKRRIEESAGIKVTVDQDNGLIRLSADELFASGQWRVVGQENTKVHQIAVAIARALIDVLPPYTFGPASRFDRSANPADALIETVQIEGHTDAVPVSGRGELQDNFDLSARRGAEMFRVMIAQESGVLKSFQNLRGMPVLSFSGYGDMRPLERLPAMSEEDYNRRNRRIDLRVILQTPQNMQEVQRIRDRLANSPSASIRHD